MHMLTYRLRGERGNGMTKEGIKAVRFCCGYNTDLRQKLDWKIKDRETCYSRKIQQFLLDNRLEIFGAFFFEKIGATKDFLAGKGLTEEQYKSNDIVLDFIEKQAFEVCTGQPSEK